MDAGFIEQLKQLRLDKIIANTVKAQLDPRAFFASLSPDEYPIILAVIGDILQGTYDAVYGLDLRWSIVEAPCDPATARGDFHGGRWYIVGPNLNSVNNLTDNIITETFTARKEADGLEDAENRQQHAMLVAARELNAANATHRRSPFASWDVTGQWFLQCDALDARYGHVYRTRCPMTIIREPASGVSTDTFLWAKFSLVAIEDGIMQFTVPEADETTTMPTDDGTSLTATAAAPHASSCRSTTDWFCDCCPTSGPRVETNPAIIAAEEAAFAATLPAFAFPLSELPCPAAPKVGFRWRGRETGADEVANRTESFDGCHVVFKGEHGLELEGSFECRFAGPVRFTGFKVADGPRVSCYRHWTDGMGVEFEWFKLGFGLDLNCGLDEEEEEEDCKGEELMLENYGGQDGGINNNDNNMV